MADASTAESEGNALYSRRRVLYPRRRSYIYKDIRTYIYNVRRYRTVWGGYD